MDNIFVTMRCMRFSSFSESSVALKVYKHANQGDKTKLVKFKLKIHVRTTCLYVDLKRTTVCFDSFTQATVAL